MNKYNRVTQMDKNEAKKLKISFNNYKRVLSWNEFNQRIEKKAYLGETTAKQTRSAIGGGPRPVTTITLGKEYTAQLDHRSKDWKPCSMESQGVIAQFKESGLCRQTGLEIKEKFNNLWLGVAAAQDLRSDKNEKYSGLKIELKGRLRGAAKSKKLSNIKGSVKSQSIDYYIEYNKKEIYTKWGILGLKIWLIK